jgi:hypothetical protein
MAIPVTCTTPPVRPIFSPDPGPLGANNRNSKRQINSLTTSSGAPSPSPVMGTPPSWGRGLRIRVRLTPVPPTFSRDPGPVGANNRKSRRRYTSGMTISVLPLPSLRMVIPPSWGRRERYGWDDAGAAYIFTRSGTTWTQQQKIQASDKQGNDEFGKSVAISGDGNTAIVGALEDTGGDGDAGAAYIFTRSGTTWTQQQKIQASDKQIASSDIPSPSPVMGTPPSWGR